MIIGTITRVDKELNVHLRERGAKHFANDIIVSPINCHFPSYGSREWFKLFNYFNDNYLGMEVIFYGGIGSFENVLYGDLKISSRHGVDSIDQGLILDIIGSTVIG